MTPKPDWSEADHEFANQVMALPKGNHDIGVYQSLFEHSKAKLTGDITPFYATLSKKKIAGIAEALPHTKVMMMVRDPIARLWSALNDAVNDDIVEGDYVSNPDVIKQAMTTRRFGRPSFATDAYKRWSAFYDVKVIFLDDVIADPDSVREDVLNFLGASSAKPTTVPSSHNSKAGRQRAQRTEAVHNVLLEIFETELKRGANKFGGPAKTWRDKYLRETQDKL